MISWPERLLYNLNTLPIIMEGPKRLSQHLPEVARSGPRPSAQYPYEDYEDYQRLSNPPAQEYQRQSIQSPNLTSEHATTPAIEDGLEPCFVPTDQPLPPSSRAPYSEIYSPGLQSVNVHHKAYPVTGVALDMPHHQQPTIQAQQPEERRRKRICGINIPWFLFLVVLIACAVIAIATACGVIFGTKKK
jgi:hypothetical protein